MFYGRALSRQHSKLKSDGLHERMHIGRGVRQKGFNQPLGLRGFKGLRLRV